jgi:prefoldin subunit 5
MRKSVKEALDLIKTELDWLEHYSKHIEKLEDKLDKANERIEELENKYETEGYDETRY